MCKIVLKDGFFHIPVDPKFVDYLCVEFPVSKRIARFRVLPFGIKCAPAIFQHLMLELKRVFELAWGVKFGDAVLVYIDDWAVLSLTRSRTQEGYDMLINMLLHNG